MFRKLLRRSRNRRQHRSTAKRRTENRDRKRTGTVQQPGTIHPHTKFKGEVYVLKKEEGGRHTPFFNGYRPQFYFRTTDVTGDLQLPEGTEMCMPGDNITMTISTDHTNRNRRRTEICDQRRRKNSRFRRCN